MKKWRGWALAAVCLLVLAGCGKTQEKKAREAYAAFLAGDTSLLDQENAETWGMDQWPALILPAGNLEYLYLDLDGDGGEELLIQYAGDPCTYNGVLHYDGGKLFCWQNDMVESSCRDYPLADGTMVRQYDYDGTRSYRLFRYRADGREENLSELFAREELIPEDSSKPCPYYTVNGEEVDKTEFDRQLEALITSQMPDASAWTPVETDS